MLSFLLFSKPFSECGPAWQCFLWQRWGSIVSFQRRLKAEILRKSCILYIFGFLLFLSCYLHVEKEISVLAAAHIEGSCPFRGSKLSTSWEMFIHKQKKAVSSNQCLMKLQFLFHRFICEHFIWGRAEERQWSDFTDVYGENVERKVLLCVFSLVERGSSIPEQQGRKLNCNRAQRVRFWLDLGCFVKTVLLPRRVGPDVIKY